jgi:hypothetical protein
VSVDAPSSPFELAGSWLGSDNEFNVDRFDVGSGSKCQPGGGEHFRLVDGVLTYTTSYGARGTLKKKV